VATEIQRRALEYGAWSGPWGTVNRKAAIFRATGEKLAKMRHRRHDTIINLLELKFLILMLIHFYMKGAGIA
jgi:hypothetical protein